MSRVHTIEWLFAGWTGLALALGGCRSGPPTMSPDEQEQQQQARERYEQAAASEAEHLEHVAQQEAEIQKVEAEITRLDEQQRVAEQQHVSATRELAEYQSLLGEGREVASRCEREIDQQGERAEKIHVALARYRSSSERNEVITALEVCRVAWARQLRTDARQVLVEMRKEFAEEIEDAFDDANPVRRGRSSFSASVKGRTLFVRMRGNFEGRARHSQEQVDAWCDRGPLFSKITLRNGHGTFRCTPEGSSNDMIDGLLADKGVLVSWLPPAEGQRPIPAEQMTPTPAFEDLARRSALTDQSQQRRQSLAKAHAAAQEAADDRQQATSELAALDRRQTTRTNDWREAIDTRQRNTRLAGIVIGATGLVSVVVGGYLFQERRTTDEELAVAEVNAQFSMGAAGMVEELQAQRARQQRGMVIGLGVGAGLLGVGALMIGLGSIDRKSSKRLTLRPSGLALRF